MIKVENHAVSIKNITNPYQLIIETLEMLTGVEDALTKIDKDSGRSLKVFYAELDDFNKLSDDELKKFRKANELLCKLGLKAEFAARPINDEEASQDASEKSALDKLIKDIIDGQQEL